MEQGTILIVDDNSQILSILVNLLRPLGHKLVCANCGAVALELATSSPPDLVLLDVMMPDMDGFTVCRALRADPFLAQVPVILITALDDRESRVRGFEAGADEFVTKPFDYVELRARASTILRLNRYRKLLAQEQRLAAERARFVWAVEHSDDGILILDHADRPCYANPRARTMLSLALDTPLDAPFMRLAQRQYTFIPPEAWASWPLHDDTPRFMVAPENRTTAERWLRVDLLPPSAGDDSRVLRLRDVTTQITSEREMWTFHAMLGHKLRTPLVGILGGLNILSGGAATMEREGIARIADVALASARRLRAEIEDILHYLRPPADLYGMEGPTLVESAAIIEHIAREFAVGSLNLSYPPEQSEARLAITHCGLEVAMREVIENTVKFHPRQQPSVVVSMQPTDTRCLSVSISDDGPGLPPDQLQHVWRPYYQGERHFTGQVEGMGLGLALVARIIHAVGGHVEIINRPDGCGALVTLTLPLVLPAGSSG